MARFAFRIASCFFFVQLSDMRTDTMQTTDNIKPHTPGPWVLDEGIDTRVYLVNNQRGHAIGEACFVDTRRAADAQLIAAAPELFAALAELLALDSNQAHADCVGQKHWRAAIAAARGAMASAKGRRLDHVVEVMQ